VSAFGRLGWGGQLSAMAAWPRWQRWLALILSYGLMAAGFGLVVQHNAAVRLLGLVVFGVSMPLVIHVGRAMMRERTRPADRRYLNEFLPAMLLYMAVMVYVWPLQKGMPPGWLKAAIALLPMLPIGWAIAASIRFVLASDELERRQHLEALAVSVSVVSVVSLALGLLSAAGLLMLDSSLVLLLIYPALCVTYGATRCFMVYRAHRE